MGKHSVTWKYYIMICVIEPIALDVGQKIFIFSFIRQKMKIEKIKRREYSFISKGQIESSSEYQMHK